jgi:glycosyltransferase involved in cell wall biosynthesis
LLAHIKIFTIARSYRLRIFLNRTSIHLFMNIGYDAKRIFQNHTGLGNYSRLLVKNFAQFHPSNSIHLFAPKVKWEMFSEAEKDKYQVHLPTSKPSWYWRTFGIAKDLANSNLDLYHGLTHELPKGIHKTSVKSLVSIHDIIFKLHKEQYKLIDRTIYDWKLKYACEASDGIIAISEHTKKDIIEHYGVSESKIHIVYQTCDDSFRQEISEQEKQKALKKYGLPKDFIFYVGSIIERKNLLTLVKAMRGVANNIPLVVVGNGKEYRQKVEEYIKQNGLENRILFLNGVSNEELPVLYQQAKVFVYPSLYEGFGIPIIEAIFSKTPVITTPFSSLPEAAGKDSTFVSGTDSEELAQAINKLISEEDETKRKVEKSLEYANRNFLPETTANRLAEVYAKFTSK